MKRFRLVLMVAGLVIGLVAILPQAVHVPTARGQAPVAQPKGVPALLEVLLPASGDDAAWQRRINTEAELLRHPGLEQGSGLYQQLAKLLPHENLPALRDRLESALTVEVVKGTALIRVWAQVSDDPETCLQATNGVVSALVSRAQAEEEMAWRERQVRADQLGEELHAAKTKLVDALATVGKEPSQAQQLEVQVLQADFELLMQLQHEMTHDKYTAAMQQEHGTRTMRVVHPASVP